MEQQIKEMKPTLIQAIQQAENLVALDEIRVKSLGKNGSITGLMKSIGKLSAEERKSAGQILNVFKDEISSLIDEKKQALELQEMNERLASQTVDITLPVRPNTNVGRIHPVSQVTEEMLTIFAQMGVCKMAFAHYQFGWRSNKSA